MLEKIGLPPKPSLRGNNWVVDSSHCQGCSTQFTFINRKHHCRRCGGLFCNSCTRKRMYLRGQGDSPVRICEPCKKLEEATRFEMRQGRKGGRGSLKSTPRDEDEVLNQVLGHNKEELSGQTTVGAASSSSTMGFSNNEDGEIQQFVSNDEPNSLGIDVGSTTPDELRQQALEEKKKYKILKGDGKSEEALRAFKRGKELERQADALEIHLRKTRKKMLSSGNLSDVHNRGISVEPGKSTKSLPRTGKEKDDLISELRELGWSDVDLHKEDRKSANLSLDGELSSIIGEVSPKTGEEKGRRIDNSQVVALKKKALTLKREGKLAEAKEELKRAKILEKQLEEQELLSEAEDSDDELSALIRGMDSDKEEFPDLHDHEHSFDVDGLLRISDDLDGNFEVTDDDMIDPQLAAALESLGWTEPEQTFDKEAFLSEIQSLKREALNQKRAGNTEEAMTFLKKAKLLERDLNSPGTADNNVILQKSTNVQKSMSSEIAGNGSDSIPLDDRNANATNNAASMAPKSRLMIQRELLSLKKKALTLRREGKLNEAEEEMQKGAALERQLMEMDKASSLKASQINSADNVPHPAHNHSDIHRNLLAEEGTEDDVTDQDMSDPKYLSLLQDLGWNDENNELSSSSSKPLKKEDNHCVSANDASLRKDSTGIMVGAPRRSKGEIQRELLGLKRKSLALRREGKTEDAEEVLKMAKALEIRIAEMDAQKNEALVEANPPSETAIDEDRNTVVSDEDMHDPALNSMLTNRGWKDDDFGPATIQEEPVKEATSRRTGTMDPSVHDLTSGIPATASRSKREIQRELLVLRRKALACRRKGEIEVAEEISRMAKSLEAQLEDFGSQNKDVLLNVSRDENPVLSESSSKSAAESSIGLERIDNETDIQFFNKSDNLIPATPQPTDDMHSFSASVSASSENLSEKMKVAKSIGNSTSAGHSMLSPDTLSSESFSSFETQKQKKYQLGSVNSSQAGTPIHFDSSVNLSQDQRRKDIVTPQKRESNEKPNMSESNAVQGSASPDQLSSRQEILAHKRKAVALKREGKLTEAKEELRQAKLLERSLEDGSVLLNTSSTNNVSDASHVVQKKQDSPSNVTAKLPNTISSSSVSDASHVQKKQDSRLNVTAKPLSSRDRFKLQQESLGHKRQALKLRRDGHTEEAEALFEKAKAIETQLEELAAQDASKSDAADDVTVEDFLDPQLLSALKAVGLEDVNVSRGPQRQGPAKSSVAKIENSNQERIQLGERIKEEKLKAVNLNRSGKQAEALDALRRAKMYEKKLSSMTSG